MGKRIVSSETSHPEGSEFRDTTRFDDGSSTDVTLEKDGTYSVDDHRPDGTTKSYIGVAPGPLGTAADVVRVREK